MICVQFVNLITSNDNHNNDMTHIIISTNFPTQHDTTGSWRALQLWILPAHYDIADLKNSFRIPESTSLAANQSQPGLRTVLSVALGFTLSHSQTNVDRLLYSFILCIHTYTSPFLEFSIIIFGIELTRSASSDFIKRKNRFD